eukprot:m.223834 g.223834  ORF g.223834 m.223834 type:complete len:329 (-) comp16337_c0_seq1:122-1108(-)
MAALSVGRTVHRGMPAWELVGNALRVKVMEIGGHIASITHTTDEINPLWQPPWPSMDFEATSKETIASVYGDVKEGQLLSSICGHNVCLDRFGAPWPGEDRPFHGEAGVSRWTLAPSTEGTAAFSVTLPLAGLAMTRSLTLRDTKIELRTHVKPLAGPRTIEWCEHVTIGDPFLDGATISAAIDGAWNWPEHDPASRFAHLPPLATLPLDDALAMPPASDPRAVGDVVTSRLLAPSFKVHNAALRKTLVYTWNLSSFPFLCLWTQHRSRTGAPWHGNTRSRGLEFSSKPFPEGKPPAERAETFMGRPTQYLVPAEGREEVVVIEWLSE